MTSVVKMAMKISQERIKELQSKFDKEHVRAEELQARIDELM